MRWLHIIVLLVVAAVFCQFCSHGTAPEPTDPGPTPQPGRTPEDFTAAEKATAGAVNNFGLKLYRAINAQADADENLFISPLSVSYAFGMAYNGANGETREELRQVLEYGDMSLEDINNSYYGLMEVLTTVDPDVIMEIANSIWYYDRFTVDPTFVDLNQRYFNAEVFPADFTAAWLPDTINHWIDTHTHGMITHVIDPPLDPELIAMLINAVYFKGLWTNPFNPDYTHETTFFLEDGTETTCDIMPKDTILPFLNTELFNATYLPYGNGYYNMMILVPDEGVTTTDVTEAMTPENWDTWRNGFTKTEILFGLPKLSYEYKIEMKDALMALGMTKAFTPYTADFTNMFPNLETYISSVFHDARIRVDEIGTEAAAVTIIMIGTVSLPPTVYCNKPFVFVIYEKTTGTILFIGKVAEPVWDE
ncbi:MAG: serpin family protein [Candidatus Zixiibacteriota bacterium]